MPDIRIGISGWTYAPWRKTFFPDKLPHRAELAFASSRVSSIEINGTFYSLQRPASYAAWYEQTPADFVFSVKAPRYITHLRRLKDCGVPVANFFASGILCLREKLGPILWQLPPSLAFDPDRLNEFLKLLPRDTRAAARLARHHDAKVKMAWTRSTGSQPLRHALEVRHESYRTPEFVGLLRRHGVALVVADTAGKWPLMEDLTADFVYIRLHGDEVLYASGYTPAALTKWAAKIRVWKKGGNPRGVNLTAGAATTRSRGRDVFVYFDNDVKVRAPFDAMSLAYKLGVGAKVPAAAADTAILGTPRERWPHYGGRPRVGSRVRPYRRSK